MTGHEEDFGFVAPARAPGAEDLPEETKEEAPPIDPFEELTRPAETTEAQEAAAEEAFESLEAEFEKLTSLRRRRDETKEVASEASKDYEAQRFRVGRAMEAQGTKQFKSSRGLGSCSVTEEYTARIADPATFIPWAKKNASELLTVNSQTLNRYVRENYRDKGVPVDDETFPPGIAAGERLSVKVFVPKPKKEQA